MGEKDRPGRALMPLYVTGQINYHGNRFSPLFDSGLYLILGLYRVLAIIISLYAGLALCRLSLLRSSKTGRKTDAVWYQKGCFENLPHMLGRT